MKRKLSRFPEVRARQKEQAREETQTLLDQIEPQPTILDHLRQIDDMFYADGRIDPYYHRRTMACIEWRDGQMLRVEVPDVPHIAPDDIARAYVERFRESLEHEMGLMDLTIHAQPPVRESEHRTDSRMEFSCRVSEATPSNPERVTGPDRSTRHAAASEQLDSTLARIDARLSTFADRCNSSTSSTESLKEYRKGVFWSFAPLWVPVLFVIAVLVTIWMTGGLGEN